jgi:PTH1 family peptidyl-tRNA hydrolase
MIKLVVALGNPGTQYEFTRHNIGWLALDQLPFYEELVWNQKFKGLTASYKIKDELVHFLKPLTFMNLSGQSVQPLMAFYKIAVSEIVIVHDEVDLPFGTIQFKSGGGLAGHNGLKSIAAILGTQDFLRIRIGVGKPVKGDVAGHVLSAFHESEERDLENILLNSAKSIVTVLESGFQKASSEYSNKDFLIK